MKKDHKNGMHPGVSGIVLCLLGFAFPGLARDPYPFGKFDPTSETPPNLISKTGLYTNTAAKTLSKGVYAYDVNAPLWSDGAEKARFISLPDDSLVTFQELDEYAFPDGAVLIKHFSLDTITGDPKSRILVETRFLILKGEWFGFSYAWNKDQKDAALVAYEGLDKTVSIRSASSGSGAGKVTQKAWRYPGRNDCRICHIPGGREVLGFYTAQLNRPVVGSASLNQIKSFFDKGLLKADKIPDPKQLFALASLTDTKQPVEHRARSYFATNCSFCHSEQGRNAGVFSTMDLDYPSAGAMEDDLNREATNGDFGIPDSRIIYPGNPEKSIILHRIKSRGNLDQMPPIGTFEQDSSAINVISEWVRTMASARGKNFAAARQPFKGPVLRNNLLYVPETMSQAVRMTNAIGSEIALKKVGPHIYTVRDDRLPAGLYHVLASGRTFSVHHIP